MKDLTALQQAVIEQLGYSSLCEEVLVELEEVTKHGAAAGFGAFIYYSDTTEFYKEHEELLKEMLWDRYKDFEYESVPHLLASFECLDEREFNDICQDYYTKTVGSYLIWNAIAWFALETVAHELEDEA